MIKGAKEVEDEDKLNFFFQEKYLLSIQILYSALSLSLFLSKIRERLSRIASVVPGNDE